MKTQRTGIIYIATNQVNLKSYIGKTIRNVNDRLYRHRRAVTNGSMTHFHCAMRTYGEAAFDWRVLEKDIPVARLDNREALWIEFYDTFYNGYNSTTGGEGGFQSAEAIAKLSATQQRNVELGKHSSQQDEWKASVSATLKAHAERGEHPAQRDEVRQKMSTIKKAQAARGELSSQQPEVKAKIVETIKVKVARGEWHSQCPEVRAKASKRHQAKIARGEHPLQNPEIHAKTWASRRRNKRLAQAKAGQQFLFKVDD